MKKDDLSAFQKVTSRVQSGEMESAQFQQINERIEKQIMDADGLITKLWQELVDNELDMVHAVDTVNGPTAEQEEALKRAESTIVAIERQSNAAKEVAGTVSEPPVSVPEASTDLQLEDLHIDDLELRVREREAEALELEFGFDTDEFQDLVTRVLGKLKKRGRIGSSSEADMSEADEKELEELEVKLASVELWVAEYETRMNAREKAESEWMAQYTSALNQVEEVSMVSSVILDTIHVYLRGSKPSFRPNLSFSRQRRVWRKQT